MILIKIYLDLLLIINFIFDFILLLSTSIILKRKIKIFKIVSASFIGSISIFLLFLRLNSFELFIIKFLISLIMIYISFGYRNFRYLIKNIYYLYTLSIILGGFLYFVNINISYKNSGLLFINNGLSINFILAIIISPIVIHIYLKESKKLKNNYNNYYNISIFLDDQKIDLIAFLDTGNKLFDPYRHRPIILVNYIYIKASKEKVLLVPYKTVNNEGILKCIKANKIMINHKLIHMNYLIGLSDNISIDGVDAILNEKILEG